MELTEKKKLPPMLARLKKRGKMKGKLSKEDVLKFGTEDEIVFLKEFNEIGISSPVENILEEIKYDIHAWVDAEEKGLEDIATKYKQRAIITLTKALK